MVEEEEPILEKAEGTTIQWAQGKDPTKKVCLHVDTLHDPLRHPPGDRWLLECLMITCIVLMITCLNEMPGTVLLLPLRLYLGR